MVNKIKLPTVVFDNGSGFDKDKIVSKGTK